MQRRVEERLYERKWGCINSHTLNWKMNNNVKVKKVLMETKTTASILMKLGFRQLVFTLF